MTPDIPFFSEMSSEVEILQSLVKEQRRQIHVMRAALTGREELFGMAADEGTAGWLKQFRRQLKDQMALEMKAANTYDDQQSPERLPHRESSISPNSDCNFVTVNNMNVPKHDISHSEQEFVDSLLHTTKELVSMWFDSLKEKYSEITSQVFNGFRSFKNNPTDVNMHSFLSKVDRLLPEAMDLLRDDEDVLGNPFQENYSELKSLYSKVIIDFANNAITTYNEENPVSSKLAEADGKYEDLSRKYSELQHKCDELSKSYQQCAAQRDTVFGDAAAWKHKFDEEKSKRLSLANELESLPSSRMSTPRAAPQSSAGVRNEPRIAELRAALTHLEVQLSACCYNSNGSEARNERIRRRVETVRRELEREEKMPRQ